MEEVTIIKSRTEVLSSTKHSSYPLSGAKKTRQSTSSKVWTYFLRSDRAPPTSKTLNLSFGKPNTVFVIPVVRRHERSESWSFGTFPGEAKRSMLSMQLLKVSNPAIRNACLSTYYWKLSWRAYSFPYLTAHWRPLSAKSSFIARKQCRGIGSSHSRSSIFCNVCAWDYSES